MSILIKKIILITLLFVTSSLFANIAKVVALKGDASIIRNNTTIKLDRNSLIEKQDVIITRDNTKVQLLFKDETIISIGGNSSFQVNDYLYDEKNQKFEAKFDMIKGTFRTITGKIGKLAPENFNLETKSASIGIRGTQIVMNLSKDSEQIFCTEGKILITNLTSKESSFVNSGEFVSIDSTNGKIDVKKIKPNDLKKINNTITIQNNLATDTISNSSETTLDTNIDINQSEITQNTSSNESNNEEQTAKIAATETESSAQVAADVVAISAKTAADAQEARIAAEKAAADAAQAAQEKEDADAAAKITAEKAAADAAQAAQEKEDATAAQAAKEKAAAKAAADAAIAQAVADAQAAKIAAEQAAKAQAAADAQAAKIATEQAAKAQAAAEAEESRIAAEKAATQKAAEEKAAADAQAAKIAAEKAAAEKAAADAQAAKIAAEKAVTDAAAAQAAAQTAEEEAVAAQAAANAAAEQAAANAAAEQAAADTEAARIAAEQAAVAQAAANAEAERIAAEQAAAAKAAANAEAERIAEEQAATAKAAADAQAAKIAAEQAAKAQAVADAQAAKIAAEQAALEELSIKTVNLFKITPETYIKNNTSVAKYKGNFNNTEYDSKSQYIKSSQLPIKIPSNTTISMDLNFGKTKNQISNGKIEVSHTPYAYYDTTFEFDGKIKNAKKGKLEINGTNGTKGDGTAYLYGNEAQAMKGEVDFISPDDIKLKGEFDANKEGFENEEFITIDDITPESYFDNFNSIATYKGNFNNYSYDDKKQYLKNMSNNNVAIPTNTSISMDVDFGASKNHISNGKLIVNDNVNNYNETFQFDGNIVDTKKATFNLKGIKDITTGNGSGTFYGSEADVMKGNVDFKSKTTNAEIKADFNATKQ